MSGQRLMMAVNAADGRTFSSLHNCRRSVPSSAGHAPASHCAYLLSATSCKSSGNMCGLWALESSPNVQKGLVCFDAISQNPSADGGC